MGFSIGGLLGGLAPIIGGIFGGPVGAAIGGVVGGAIGSRSSQVSPAAFGPSIAGPSVSLPGATPVAGALVPGAMGAARALIRALLARAGATLGRRVSHRTVRDLVKQVGIAAAAAALGLTAVEIAQILAAEPKRRRRGITARDITTTKRVLRRTASIQHDLSTFVRPHRRVTARGPHHARA